MGVLLGLFSSKATWVVIVAALVATILGVQHARITYLKHAVEDRDSKIEVMKVEMKQAREIIDRWAAAYTSLEKTVATQNDQIALYEKEARLRFEHAQIAIRVAAKNRTDAEKVAQTIIRMELANDECKALGQLVDAARSGGLR